MAIVDNEPISLASSFLRVMAILRRLKYTDAEIKENILALKDEKQDLFVRYVLPYDFLFEKNVSRDVCMICINNEDRRAHQALLRLNKETGTASIETRYMRQGDELESDF